MPFCGTDVAAIAFYALDGSAENLWDMEKVVLLCLLVAVIGLLAELAPTPQPQRKT